MDASFDLLCGYCVKLLNRWVQLRLLEFEERVLLLYNCVYLSYFLETVELYLRV